MFGMGLAVGDYNLDGHLDLYATNINDNVLLKSDGDGLAFTDATARARARGGKVARDRDRYSWGAMFMDYDNDGDEDLYVVSGHLEGQEHNPLEQPNILLRNDGGRFKDVSEGSGADDPGIGRGGAFLDLDGDGCLDIVVGNVGQRVSVLRNLCHLSNGWLIVETVGTVGNRDGIGARITLVAEGKTQIREISSGCEQRRPEYARSPLRAGLGRRCGLADDQVAQRPSPDALGHRAQPPDHRDGAPR